MELPNKEYQCLVVDPPWYYQLRTKDTTHRNRIPYEPMQTAEILNLPIPDLCDRTGTVLWLWTTNNHIGEAIQCLQAWGFTQKTILTWVKVTKKGTPHLGVGHWLRNCTEHCILATCGKVKAFSTSSLTNQPTVLYAPRREHSRKPDEFYSLVESLCPSMTKLDMFARQSRPGWDTWGDEATKFDQVA